MLSGASDAAYTGPAMAAVKSQLHDEPAGLLQLLAPPFAQSINNPGYIQAYPRGVIDRRSPRTTSPSKVSMAARCSHAAEPVYQLQPPRPT